MGIVNSDTLPRIKDCMAKGKAPSWIDAFLHLPPGTAHDVVVEGWMATSEARSAAQREAALAKWDAK